MRALRLAAGGIGAYLTGVKPIEEVAARLGLHPEDVVPFGRGMAKVELVALERPPRGRGRLVLVSAITPTRAGEGKTTVAIGLAMGLQRLGRRAAVCLRQPSLGPIFGRKGAGTGGGRASIVPADDINLHFTGDLHAVASAHNLLAALADNELHFGGPSGLDPGKIDWPRVVDMNDRVLRRITVGLGGAAPRESRFDITAASEVMAALSLASSLEEMRERLARMVVGWTRDDRAVTARDLGAVDAMLALLVSALRPNLVQTTEGGPALVHGGPFANIAHGCSSLLATRLAMRCADEVITEAGFGFDLGGEKFLHLKCRGAGIWPRVVVLVATVRALRAHGGGEDRSALRRGLLHLDRQIANVQAFGLPVLVAINVFGGDPGDEIGDVESRCAERGVPSARTTAFADGGAGAEALARALLDLLDATDRDPPAPRFLYGPGDALEDKLRALACGLYGARDVVLGPEAAAAAGRLEALGHRELPVCVAKTHLSLSADPGGGGLASGFDLPVRELRLAAGAGYVVALAGDVSTMPGLPRDPAAVRIHVDPGGRIHGVGGS